MTDRVLLIINRSDSKCGACNTGTDPNALYHAVQTGYGTGGLPGCGARFTHVTSHYVGVEEAARRMRPDLEWVPIGFGY